LLAISLVTQEFQGIHIFGPDGLFPSLGDHATLHPHLDPFGRLKVGALRDKRRRKTGIACSEDFVVEGLNGVRSSIS
jgi:hypothetical protein